jgi:glycosyltransferase involved in cell wall biosynthesis
MNDQMRISVIVPTFNRSNMLRDCIESLLNQTLDPALYEVIIVDNNSKDATRETVNEYLGLERYNVRYVLEPQQGLQFTRNTGAKSAHAAILAYTDDDAVCDVRWLEELLRAYDDEEIGCAGGKIIVKWDEEPPAWVLPYSSLFGQLDETSQGLTDETTLGSTFRVLQPGEEVLIFGGNCSIRKSIFFELGGFGMDQVGEVRAGDSETGLWIKAHKKGIKIAWVPDAIVWHMQIASKNATLSDVKRRFANWGAGSTIISYKKIPRGGLRLLASAVRSFCTGVRYKAIVAVKSARGPPFDYQHELCSSYFLKKAQVKLDLAFSKRKRESVLRENWLE